MVCRECGMELQNDDRVCAHCGAETDEFEAPKGAVVTTDRFEEAAKAALAANSKEEGFSKGANGIPTDAKLAETLAAAEKAVKSGKRRVEEDAEEARANIIEKLGEPRERTLYTAKTVTTQTAEADMTQNAEEDTTQTAETATPQSAEEDTEQTAETATPQSAEADTTNDTKEAAIEEDTALVSEENTEHEVVEETPTKVRVERTRLVVTFVVAAALLAAFWFIKWQHRSPGSETGSSAQHAVVSTSKNSGSAAAGSKEKAAENANAAADSKETANTTAQDIPASIDLEWESADDMPMIKTEAAEPIGMAILQHAELGRGIGAILQVPTLTIPEDADLAGLSDAGEFTDSVWYEEGGSKKTYADALIACIITYYKDLYDAEDGKHLDVLEIGEIRQGQDAFFVAARIHDHLEPHEEAGEVTILTDTLRIRMADKQATVEERETTITSTPEGEDS